jgi:hypothetical protein
VLRVRFIDRIDEVIDEDIVRGPKTSVDEVMRRAAERMTQEMFEHMKNQRVPLADPPKWWIDVPDFKILTTPAELVEEGKFMRHCVGAYSGYVKNKQSVIIAISKDKYRSTAEVDYNTMSILQHMTFDNKPVAPKRKQELIEFLAEARRLLEKDKARYFR